MRRILHLLALLALILVGSVPELRLEAATEPASSCCCGMGCGCGMPTKGPSPSPCQTQVTVTLTATPAVSAPDQARQSEARREPLPWPAYVASRPRTTMDEGTPIRGPSAIAPSPPDRLTQLSTFRI
ncbi:hypothetical protein [Holophaga foetida]|uniref:hypothetical protein n=1 Tax=Holophaga foetida TaxID=35839 RepID=UPI0002474D24|nr:hypothetical protein [Holophaga foetida]